MDFPYHVRIELTASAAGGASPERVAAARAAGGRCALEAFAQVHAPAVLRDVGDPQPPAVGALQLSEGQTIEVGQLGMVIERLLRAGRGRLEAAHGFIEVLDKRALRVGVASVPRRALESWRADVVVEVEPSRFPDATPSTLATEGGVWPVEARLDDGPLGPRYRARRGTGLVDVEVVAVPEAAVAEVLREAALPLPAHSAIVPTLEVGRLADGRVFIARTASPARTLAMSLGADPWSVERAAALGRALAEALDVARAAGLVHGALGASAILVPESGPTVARVMGFGLARAVRATPPEADLVRAGDGGWALYAGPEVWTGAVEAGSDVHALGALVERFVGMRRSPRPADLLRARSVGDVVREQLGPRPAAALAGLHACRHEVGRRPRPEQLARLFAGLLAPLAELGRPVPVGALARWGVRLALAEGAGGARLAVAESILADLVRDLGAPEAVRAEGLARTALEDALRRSGLPPLGRDAWGSQHVRVRVDGDALVFEARRPAAVCPPPPLAWAPYASLALTALPAGEPGDAILRALGGAAWHVGPRTLGPTGACTWCEGPLHYGDVGGGTCYDCANWAHGVVF